MNRQGVSKAFRLCCSMMFGHRAINQTICFFLLNTMVVKQILEHFPCVDGKDSLLNLTKKSTAAPCTGECALLKQPNKTCP